MPKEIKKAYEAIEKVQEEFALARELASAESANKAKYRKALDELGKLRKAISTSTRSAADFNAALDKLESCKALGLRKIDNASSERGDIVKRYRGELPILASMEAPNSRKTRPHTALPARP